MEIVSLHPIDPHIVQSFVAALTGEVVDERMETWLGSPPRLVLDRSASGSERATSQITAGFALALSQAGPVFASQPAGFSFWEAQVDRSMGLLMRPPARLFLEAGLGRGVVRTMPIRLVTQAGMMGGAWIPAHLIPTALAVLEDHLERSARRLQEAELDSVLALEIMYTALVHAQDQGVGLYEAQDLVVEGVTVPGMQVYWPDVRRLPPKWLARIQGAITPPKKPGLFDRLLRRVDVVERPATNGHFSDVTAVEHHEPLDESI